MASLLVPDRSIHPPAVHHNIDVLWSPAGEESRPHTISAHKIGIIPHRFALTLLCVARSEDIRRLCVVGPVRSQAHDTTLLGRSVVGNRGEAAFLSTSIVGSQAGETTLLLGRVIRSQASETTLFELGCLAFGLVHEQAASRNVFLYIANTSEAHWSGGNGCHQER